MTTHIYAFGSVCRGEITPDSDVDLLAITLGSDDRFNPDTYSIYSHSRLKEIWGEGSPFAWHLSLESKLVFSSNGLDFLRDLGRPAEYRTAIPNCRKFYDLFVSSANALVSGTNSPVFEMSTIFLAIRNFATCYSLGNGIPDFSRYSALRIGVDSLTISHEIFRTLERARLLCTRGTGNMLTRNEAKPVTLALNEIEKWMQKLLTAMVSNEQLQ